MLKVGDAAPDFKLIDDQGNEFDLAAARERGPVVLVFYPMDQTPVCTTQLCEFRDAYQELTDRGLTVVGINPGGVTSHHEFSTRHRLPFPLLVDDGTMVARAYRTVFGLGPLRITRRSVYGVDQDGIIRFARPGKPALGEVFEALAAR